MTFFVWDRVSHLVPRTERIGRLGRALLQIEFMGLHPMPILIPSRIFWAPKAHSLLIRLSPNAPCVKYLP